MRYLVLGILINDCVRAFRNDKYLAHFMLKNNCKLINYSLHVSGLTCATLWAMMLPPVKQSIYFNQTHSDGGNSLEANCVSFLLGSIIGQIG